MYVLFFISLDFLLFWCVFVVLKRRLRPFWSHYPLTTTCHWYVSSLLKLHETLRIYLYNNFPKVSYFVYGNSGINMV
jgi:hypothetical protein